MTKYRRKEVVEIISYNDLIKYGIEEGADLNHGMPEVFNYKGYEINYDYDLLDGYVFYIPTKPNIVITKNDMLVTDDNGIWTLDRDTFLKLYQKDNSSSSEQNAKYKQVIHTTDANTDLSDFISEMINKYNLKNSQKSKYVKYHNCENSDDKIVQLVCDNRLIAVGIERRTDLNYEEYTLIDLQREKSK